jgi:hypothetical protein
LLTNISQAVRKYFGHTRIEDMADNQTRRVIETQSDLMENDRLSQAFDQADFESFPKGLGTPARQGLISDIRNILKGEPTVYFHRDKGDIPITDEMIEDVKSITDEYTKLQPYEKHWWKRILREEIKQAANDGKKKVQFPDGETAMRIEKHLNDDEVSSWMIKGRDSHVVESELKVGLEVLQGGSQNDVWIVTEVRDNGGFRAVPKDEYKRIKSIYGESSDLIERQSESFHLTSSVDKTNSVYKRAEEYGKWLKNNFNAKLVTDDNGITRWYEVDAESFKDKPVLAFGKAKIGSILTGAGVTAGALGLESALTKAGTVHAESTKQSILDKEKPKPQVKGLTESKAEDITKAILYRENRGATSTGENLYEVIGVTGDLGKYQVSPETLKDWSPHWLDKEYTIQEFLHSPEAQEAFYNEFLRIVDAYELTKNEALAAWHKGWGIIGSGEGTREESKEKFKKHLQNLIKTDPQTQKYIKGE